MSKKIALLLASVLCALACIFALTGCKDTTDNTGSSDTETSTGTTTDTDTGSADTETDTSTDTKADTDIPIYAKTENKINASNNNKNNDEYIEKGTFGLEYEEIKENNVVIAYSVKGIGTATDTDIVIPSVYNGKPVKSIGTYAFSYCSNLTSITIPNSVTSIRSAAFSDCNNLVSITIGNGVTSIGSSTFYNCSSLTSVTIGNSVASIGDYAFYRCSSLKSITMPDSIVSVGWRAFYGCSSLTYNEYDNACYLGNESNPYAVLVKAKHTLIVSCIINENTEIVAGGAFEDCNSLTGITIPHSVTSIDWRAFDDCYKLVEVYNLSNISITKGSNSNGCVGYYALNVYTDKDTPSKQFTTDDGYIFYEDAGTRYLLGYNGTDTGLTLPANYNGKTYEIYKYAFYNNKNITSVTILDNVTNIGSYALYGCTKLTSITIPNSVISIDDWAFYNCTSLTNITIPDSVTSIGNYAFNSCSSLTSITIPNGVTSIGNYTFYGCGSLTSVTIENSVTNIGSYAFYGCGSLTSVTFKNTSGWKVSTSSDMSGGRSVSVSDPSTAVKYLTNTYCNYYWKRS